MATDNKELARRVIEEIWNNQQVDLADEMIAGDFVQHDPQSPFPVQGLEAYKQFVQHYLKAFPDLHFSIEEIVSEGQTVVTRWSSTGTHSGNLPGIPATGRRTSSSGIVCSRVENGRLVESWSNWDTLGLMQQLGVIPGEQLKQAA